VVLLFSSLQWHLLVAWRPGLPELVFRPLPSGSPLGNLLRATLSWVESCPQLSDMYVYMYQSNRYS
jgi:hypothetical protein